MSVVYDFSIIGYANIATTWVCSNRSVFRITVMVGFGGSALDPSLAETGASSQRVGGAAGAHGTRSPCDGAPIDADSQAG